ncbi:MAG: hypothetical protein ACR2P7_03925 [bacterium]
MKNAKIFLINPNHKKLTAMREAAYASEDDLQGYLARYPDLLPGEQIDPENPRRWLLVAREMGVPDAHDGGDRWSLDHLFLDQDGTPTFVECKRSSDTRARREVVSQMLDYAANGIEYWSMDRLRQAAAETAIGRNRDLDDEIAELIEADDDADVEAYWSRVEDNLKHGKVRLIFVADEIPKELRRLVEFINQKMADVEVMAVEIKQFLGADDRAVLVPQALGLTEAVRAAKHGSSSRRSITRAEFMHQCADEHRAFFERVIELAEKRGHLIQWGIVGFSVRKKMPETEKLMSFIFCHPEGRFEFYFGYLPLPAEQQDELRRRLMEFGVLQKSKTAEKTIHAVITQDNLADLERVYGFILDRIDSIA